MEWGLKLTGTPWNELRPTTELDPTSLGCFRFKWVYVDENVAGYSSGSFVFSYFLTVICLFPWRLTETYIFYKQQCVPCLVIFYSAACPHVPRPDTTAILNVVWLLCFLGRAELNTGSFSRRMRSEWSCGRKRVKIRRTKPTEVERNSQYGRHLDFLKKLSFLSLWHSVLNYSVRRSSPIQGVSRL